MKKLVVTAQQRANALEALNVFWPSIKPAQVAHHLRFWREDEDEQDNYLDQPPGCGTVACFGGWLEWHTPFRSQLGLASDKGEVEFEELLSLFGTTGNAGGFNIFAERNFGFPADFDFTGTDHELVSNRLRWLIENSEVTE
jgi:hypothetical protein